MPASPPPHLAKKKRTPLLQHKFDEIKVARINLTPNKIHVILAGIVHVGTNKLHTNSSNSRYYRNDHHNNRRRFHGNSEKERQKK